MTHDLARLQQSFDEEGAKTARPTLAANAANGIQTARKSMRVTRQIRRIHLGSAGPSEPNAVVLRQIIRESRGALRALAIAALGYFALGLALPA